MLRNILLQTTRLRSSASHLIPIINIPKQALSSTSNMQATPPDPSTLSATTIMEMNSNKATRFVYLRTLPLIKQPELSTSVESLASAIETTTKTICERHVSLLVDDRAAVHLHTAALAIATFRVLEPRLKDAVRVENMIRAGFGAELRGAGNDDSEKKKQLNFWIVRMGLWFAFDKMNAVEKMTENMERDFGAAFDVKRHSGEGPNDTKWHSLHVTKCLYNQVCRAEGLQHLTKIFCALDKAIYSPITKESHKIIFDLKKTLADDHDHDQAGECEFRFDTTK